MILSTTEGADKPSKYPLMFYESKVLLINKMDLAHYVDFDLEKARKDARAINPGLHIMEVSCKSGKGLEDWFSWIGSKIEEFKKSNT